MAISSRPDKIYKHMIYNHHGNSYNDLLHRIKMWERANNLKPDTEVWAAINGWKYRDDQRR